MSKKVLKEQHPWANINYIDILSKLDPSGTNKFLPLLIKTLKSEMEARELGMVGERKYIIEDLISGTNVDPNDLNDMNFLELELYRVVLQYLNKQHISLLVDFNDHLNDKRIEKNDISQYNSFDEIREAVKIASFKQAEKDLKGSTHIVYEDDKWLMIKPLTFESSKKYGSSTKWCTTMVNSPNYFYNYSENGALIYIFNKDTNEKVAAHIRLLDKGTYDNPVRLYNELDVETDSFVLQLPKHVMEMLMVELKKGITNKIFIKVNYPKIYESEWKNRGEEKCIEMVEEVATPMEEPMNVTEAEGLMEPPEVNLAPRTNQVVGEVVGAHAININGRIGLNDEAVESLNEQLGRNNVEVDDILNKIKDYTKTNFINNLWRKLFIPKIIAVGVPRGSMPVEDFHRLESKVKGCYFIFYWSNEYEVTFKTL